MDRTEKIVNMMIPPQTLINVKNIIQKQMCQPGAHLVCFYGFVLYMDIVMVFTWQMPKVEKTLQHHSTHIWNTHHKTFFMTFLAIYKSTASIGKVIFIKMLDFFMTFFTGFLTSAPKHINLLVYKGLNVLILRYVNNSTVSFNVSSLQLAKWISSISAFIYNFSWISGMMINMKNINNGFVLLRLVCNWHLNLWASTWEMHLYVEFPASYDTNLPTQLHW